MTATLSFPNTDDALLQWSQNVVNLITPTPATWGILVGDVTSYTALHAAYSTALTACEKSIRTESAVIIKNQCRTNLKAGASTLANKIYADTAVTDAMKVQIGMPPRATPMPIPAPTSAPTITILSLLGWTVRVRLSDPGGSPRGKPVGTLGAAIFTAVGETAPANIEAWTFQGNCGRVNAVDVSFPTTLAGGTKVWITSFWFNGRKQSGPPATAIGVSLPGGSVQMAA